VVVRRRKGRHSHIPDNSSTDGKSRDAGTELDDGSCDVAAEDEWIWQLEIGSKLHL